MYLRLQQILQCVEGLHIRAHRDQGSDRYVTAEEGKHVGFGICVGHCGGRADLLISHGIEPSKFIGIIDAALARDTDAARLFREIDVEPFVVR